MDDEAAGTREEPATPDDAGTPDASEAPEEPATPEYLGSSQPASRWLRALVIGVLLALVALAIASIVLTRPADTAQVDYTGIDASIDRAVEQGATLALAAREVLTSARALDPDAVDAAITTGSQASAAISALREDLIKRREVITRDINSARLSEADRIRIGTIDRALIGMTQLPGSWVEVVGAASDPVDLVRSIHTHDAGVAEATAAARADDLLGALEAIQDARRLLAPAHAVREVANEAGADVSILSDLLARLDTYDKALEKLWTLVTQTQGQVTDEVRSAYAEVEAAQASLPLNQDALKVIVSDLAGPAITAILLDIEQQRGLLAEAVEARPYASPARTTEG